MHCAMKSAAVRGRLLLMLAKHFMSIEAFMRSQVSNIRSERCNMRTREKDELLMLDLYCGAGGATKGYKNAGFKVLGIDIKPQPRYCGDWFIQMSALDCDYELLALFDLIHASPPCQAYSKASATARKRGKQYPDLIPQTRQLLAAASKPFVMENVESAPVRADICLDGTMFGLGVIRRRIFETNIPNMPRYPKPSKIEGSVGAGDYVTVAGKGGGAGSRLKRDWAEAMRIDWMLKYELKESIPPAFTEWIGLQALLRLIPGSNLLPVAASNIRSRYYLTENQPSPKTPVLYAKTHVEGILSEIRPQNNCSQ